ncbi:hypothetical protein BVW01_13605 [Mycobacterium tuberculosis]|nr:hypothetical protein BVW01_13605 [Mycobacterium tuberculosis]
MPLRPTQVSGTGRTRCAGRSGVISSAAMSIKVALEHRTSYTFDRLVRVYPHIVRLRPAPHSRTSIEAYSLRIEPADHFINWQQDALGNFLARLVFPNPMRQLRITVGLIADLKVINPFDFFIEDWAEIWPCAGMAYPKALADDLRPYLRPVDEDGDGSGPGELTQAWVRNFTVPDGTRTIDFLVALNRAINADVGLRMEPGVQTPDFTLRTGVGSCRDSAWLLVSILRQFGLAARFVSGYLVQLASDIEALDGPSGPAADFTDLHAWAEAYIPGAGWIGLDPTSGLLAGEGHIPLAATPHPASAAPISGGTDVCDTVLEFSNTVTRVHEDPRVTLPYTDESWKTICEVGQRVDERLAAADVRLTVGGEPTFVSVDNQVAEEWRTAADGPHKRERASDLAARLKAVWAPQGLIHRGQGRWYPGEPLPRWQIALYWRTDGRPLWTNDALLADLDPWAGGIDLLVGGETAPGLRWPDLALQGGRLNWSAVRAALPRPRGISVLSGTRRGYELDAGPVDAVIDAGRRGGVTVVCDLPRRLTDATQAALDAADLVVLVSPCDVRACAAAATMAPVLTAINPNLGLVVRGPSPGGLRAAEVADVAGVPLLASMRAQPRLAEQLEHGGLRLRRRSVLASAARRVLGVLPRAGSGRHGRAA